MEKCKKSHIRIINLKSNMKQFQHGMKNFKYLIDHVLYQTFKIISDIFKDKFQMYSRYV